MKTEQGHRLAVLIDGENVHPATVAFLFKEVTKLGEATLCRLYGNFLSGQLNAWLHLLPKYQIEPHLKMSGTPGKNAADIALVIDAMDLLHSKRFDGFCIVSSDSDFTRLAQRLAEAGAAVYGFGNRKSPESFRRACRRFSYLESHQGDFVSPACNNTQTRTRQSAGAALPTLRHALSQMEADGSPFILARLGNVLKTGFPEFDTCNYGCSKLSVLMVETGAFEIKSMENGITIKAIEPGSS